MDSKAARTIHVEHGYDRNSYTYYPVLIIGAGESGIAMGCRLKKKLGFDQFRIFDRQSGVGGTWWINRYPGVQCDVPCAFYSFSWEPFYDANALYPSGGDVVKYLHRVASKYHIVDKIQLNTEVTELRWLEPEKLWEATLSYMAPGTGDMGEKQRQEYIQAHGRDAVYLKQEKVRAKIAISGVGALVEPRAWPDSIPGKDVFRGEVIHSARWKDDAEINDKKVVIVGTGCSSVQVMQAILQEPYNAKSVTQLMRTPPWCTKKVTPYFGNENFPNWGPFVLDKLRLGIIFRFFIFIGAEFVWSTIFLNNETGAKGRAKAERKLLERMRRKAPKQYHEMLTPDYGIGCKRRIFDPNPGWYDSMNDPRFRLTTQTLKSLRADGVVLSGNQTYPPSATADKKTEDEFVPADVVVLANGFDMTTWLHPLRVVGRDGRPLHDVWKERGGPQAYLGTAMDECPNFFIIFGPNTATGHSSVILAIENMVEHTLLMIEPVLKGDVSIVEIKKNKEIEYTERLQRELKDTVFMSGGCISWYFDENEEWNSTVYW